YFWLYEVEVRQAGWRVVPDTSAHLLYHAVDRAGEKNSLEVVGARTQYTDIDLTARRFTVGARLRPGALSVLTTRHAHDFTDLAVPLAQLDQAWADQLYRALESAASPRATLQVMNCQVTHRLSGHHVDRWVRQLAAELARPAAAVREVSADLGWSSRWLRERFQRAVGLAPKRFARLSRLFRALDQLVDASDPNWSAMASSCGYFDQSHLIHEFDELLGESPARFLERRTA
ncbi:MAG: helix-turn-helix domain-containing protein, partial [Longimicrobiales bacterium]